MADFNHSFVNFSSSSDSAVCFSTRFLFLSRRLGRFMAADGLAFRGWRLDVGSADSDCILEDDSFCRDWPVHLDSLLLLVLVIDSLLECLPLEDDSGSWLEYDVLYVPVCLPTLELLILPRLLFCEVGSAAKRKLDISYTSEIRCLHLELRR